MHPRYSIDTTLTARPAVQSAGDGWHLRAMLPLLAGLLAGLTFAFFSDPWTPHTVLGVLLAVIGVYLAVRLASEYVALKALEKGVLLAREGLLDPISTEPHAYTRVGHLIHEYNRTIATLRAMFETVEECQGRFLGERNKINTILQSLPEALLSVSDDLRVTMANLQAEQLFGVERPKLIGANLFDLLTLSEHDRETLRDAFLYKQPLRSQEIALAQGTMQRFYSLNLGFYNDEENDMGSVLILVDITVNRRMHEGIAQREKLVAMGQMAGGVAHELNTPLGSIMGYAQLLERAANGQPKLADYARIISEETNRCSRIITNLLDYARREQCTGETCEINQLLRDLTETFINCRLRRYKIRVDMSLAPGNLVAEGDGGQIEIVVSNLLINAIHAVDGVSDPVISLNSWQEGDFVFIGIADNGPGVPPDIRNRIFDPFFTTKEAGQGSGLGLSLSHAIVTKRGGSILYDTDYVDGARFLIKLPAVDVARAGL